MKRTILRFLAGLAFGAALVSTASAQESVSLFNGENDTLHSFTVRGAGRVRAGAEAKPPATETVRIAGLVLRWIYKDKEANFRRLEPLVREAAKGGARIVVTTECALDGYLMKDDSIPPAEYRALAEPIPDGKYFRRLAALAAELRIYLVAGMTEADGDLCYNTAALIGPDGRLLGRYRKHALEHEIARNTPGTNMPAFGTSLGRFGMMICADRKNAELASRIVADGAEFLICLSGGMCGPANNDAILQARSKENGRYIVFVHPRQFLVTAPDGRILTSALTGSEKEIADIKAGLGSEKEIAANEIGSEKDAKQVFYVDLPLKQPTEAQGLVGHWKLQGDCKDYSGRGNHGKGRNVTFGEGVSATAQGAVVLNGRDSLVEVPDAESLQLGTGDFSLSAWVKPEGTMSTVFGDIVSKFDAQRRRGLNFHLAGSSSGYQSMCDARHVHVGLDDGHLGPWEDCGKPWPSNNLITCFVVFEGELYCGIADAGDPQDAAHVFRFGGGTKWIDCGRLGNDPNHLSVQSMIVHQGKLYAGTGIWDWERARGEQPGKPRAAKPRVFVYEGGTKWRDLGQVGETTRVLCMASFQDELYVGLDRARPPQVGKCFKYTGAKWVDCGSPDGRNFENLLPLGGTLYGATHGSIYRYKGGQNWECIGERPFGIEQIHSIEVYRGRLHVGTWPQGYVLRYEGDKKWTNTGRLGLPLGNRECNEINDLMVYNGKLYAGVLPKGEAYRYESDGRWTLLGSLGHRPDFAVDDWSKWCRLTAMASFGGKLFAGTGACRARASDGDPDGSLGRVYSVQAGQVASYEREIGGGWTHLAVVRRGADLRLYINGRLSASSTAPEGRALDLSNSEPLLIGFGAQSHFSGAIADVRLHARALDAEEVLQLHSKRAAQ